MKSPDQLNNNQQDYFAELVVQLRVDGHVETADKLDFMLHRVAWTTGSEMLGEVGAELLNFQRINPSVTSALQEALSCSLEIVRSVWP